MFRPRQEPWIRQERPNVATQLCLFYPMLRLPPLDGETVCPPSLASQADSGRTRSEKEHALAGSDRLEF